MTADFYLFTTKESLHIEEPGYQVVTLDVPLTSNEYPGFLLDFLVHYTDSDLIGLLPDDYLFIKEGRILSLQNSAEMIGEGGVILPKNVKNPIFPLIGFREDLIRFLSKNPDSETFYEELSTYQTKQSLPLHYVEAIAVDLNRITDTKEEIQALSRPFLSKYQNFPPLEDAVPTVWLCWWQGEDSAPDIVKRCISRTKSVFSKYQIPVQVITLENVSDFVTIPELFWKRLREGGTTYTNLSDYLRVSLLNKYGGIWIDATYYIADDRFLPTLISYPFFTERAGGEYNELDLVSGRWAMNILKGPKHFPLFGFIQEGFEKYWESHETLINYFLIDYFMDAAYELLPNVRAIIDALPVNRFVSLVIEDWGNLPFDQRKWDFLLQSKWLLKITYRNKYVTHTPEGLLTFYGYLMQNKEEA